MLFQIFFSLSIKKHFRETITITFNFSDFDFNVLFMYYFIFLKIIKLIFLII